MVFETHLFAADRSTSPAKTKLSIVFPYANVVALLNWANVCTCLDLSFTISVLTQNIHTSDNVQVFDYKDVFCYLRSTVNLYLEH